MEIEILVKIVSWTWMLFFVWKKLEQFLGFSFYRTIITIIEFLFNYVDSTDFA